MIEDKQGTTEIFKQNQFQTKSICSFAIILKQTTVDVFEFMFIKCQTWYNFMWLSADYTVPINHNWGLESKFVIYFKITRSPPQMEIVNPSQLQ